MFDVVELLCPIIDNGKVYSQVELREITGYEEDILFNRNSKLSMGRRLAKVIENCIVKIQDISDRSQIERLTQKLALSNVWYLLLRLRILSIGDEYGFEVVCPNCQTKFKRFVRLSELEYKKGNYKDENGISVNLTDGRVVVLKPEVLGDDHAWVSIEARQDVASHIIYGRVFSINGQRVGLEDIKKLSMKDRNILRRAIEDMEGGIDDSVEVECSECSNEFVATLEFAGRDFFMPVK